MGVSSDNISVTSVTWANDRGGNGTASGTGTWTIPDIPLHCGDDNIITITAKDAAGNTATDTLTINVKSPIRLAAETVPPESLPISAQGRRSAVGLAGCFG
jgi:hypothetical protein